MIYFIPLLKLNIRNKSGGGLEGKERKKKGNHNPLVSFQTKKEFSYELSRNPTKNIFFSFF